MGLRLNHHTGLYENVVDGPPDPPSLKKLVWLGGLVLSVVVSIITYTVTVTLAYSQVQKDVALMKQALDLRIEVEKTQHSELINRIDRLEGERQTLAVAVQANTEALQFLIRGRR